MPKFEVEQYELHAMKYRVKANTQAEAIIKVLNGLALPVDGSLEFVEIARGYGLAVEENRELADRLRSLGVAVGEAVIPSIRSIERIE